MREVRIALLTNLKSRQKQQKTSQASQPWQAMREVRIALLTNLNFQAKTAKKTSQASQPWQAMRELRIALLTNLNFQARAPCSLPGNCICEIFIDFNLLFTHVYPCLHMFTHVDPCLEVFINTFSNFRLHYSILGINGDTVTQTACTATVKVSFSSFSLTFKVLFTNVGPK